MVSHRLRSLSDGLQAPLLRLSLHRRIAVFITCVVLAMVLALAYLGWQALSQSTAATLQERQTTAMVMARHLDDFVGDARTSLSVVATELVNSNAELDRERSNEVLQRAMLHLHQYFTHLILLAPDARAIAISPPVGDLHFTPAAQAMLDRTRLTSQPGVSNRLRLPVGDSDGVLFVAPVGSDGRLLALLAGAMPIPHPSMSSLAGGMYLGETGHLEVIDSTGHLLAYAGLDSETQTEHPELYLPLIASGSSAVGRAYSDHDEAWHVMAFAPLMNAPWGVGVGQTEAETFAPTLELRDRTLAAAAVALALTLGFAWVGTQSVVNPIRTLTRAGERMATGDLSQPIKLVQPDEIGRLAYVLDTVRRRLRHSLEETAEWNRRLEERVQQRTRELEQTNRHLHTMMAVATAANASNDHVAVMQTALRELVKTLDVRGGWVSVYDEHQPQLRLVTAYGLPASVQAAEANVTLLDAACIQSLHTADAVCALRNNCSAAAFKRGVHQTDSHGACWISPIRMDDQPLGVLCLLSRRGRKLEDKSRDLLQSVAQQIGMSFQKARLADERARFEASRHMELLRAEFLASVSHELRTPLGFIKGYTTTLLREDVEWQPAQEREFLQIIDEESDHLTELVDSVLDVARGQAGRMRLNLRHLDAVQVVRRSLERANGVIGARDVRLQSASPVGLEADASRMEQVVLNLLVNAAKYSTPESPIDVSVARAGADVQIAVLDRGVGISTADAERIFEPFYRAQSQATAAVGGAGLGLAVCRAIVEAHGGRIWAEPREGGGTGVFLTLPAGTTQDEGTEHAQ